MEPGKRKRRRRVIEGRRCPVGGRVADGAIGREARCGVRRIGGPVPVGLMAVIAGSWQGQVIVIGMAGRARYGGVRAGKRERRVVVIECRSGPVRGAVAGIAGGGEARSGMRRTVGSIPIRLVAAVARGRQ